MALLCILFVADITTKIMQSQNVNNNKNILSFIRYPLTSKTTANMSTFHVGRRFLTPDMMGRHGIDVRSYWPPKTTTDIRCRKTKDKKMKIEEKQHCN